MTMQVVDSGNLIEFVQTGKVPEFKPPESAAPAPVKDTAPASDPKVTASPESAPKGTPQRDGDGKFTKAAEPDKNAPTAATAGKDGEEDALPERAQARIDKKHRAMREAEEREQVALRRLQDAERRAEEAERKLRGEPKSEPAQTRELTAPKPEDFKTVAEYADAVVDYKLKKRADDEAKQRQVEEQAERERAFLRRLSEAKAKHDDWDSVVSALTGSQGDQVPVDVIAYIQESEQGADLLYHLAKHPDTLDRLRKLSPRRFIAELGKLEDRLVTPPEPKAEPKAAEPEKPKAQVSKAPAPIAPLDLGGAAPVAKDPAQMSVAELREYRREHRQA
jgi:hypothetical protein